jgi:hypothetical protein
MAHPFLVSIAAGFCALGLNYPLARVAAKITDVPSDWPPFTFVPQFAGCIGGSLLAGVVGTLIGKSTNSPRIIFMWIALVCLTLSFGLPLRLSFTQSSRFAGTTVFAQVFLAGLHSIVAITNCLFLFRFASPFRPTR